MLLYHEKSFPTGHKIAEALQSYHGYSSRDDLNPTGDFLIRWGSRRDEWLDNEFDQVLNNCEAIALASNKYDSFNLFREAGLNIPDYDTDPFALLERVGYPILGRKFRGARGTDIKLCLQERDFRKPKQFYTQYIPTRREFRVHVVNGNVVRVQGKFLDIPSQWQAHVRNYASGYRFRNPRLRLRSERLQDAITAVSVLNLDFGAVDLLIGDDNLTYILEVNTAPSCSPITATAYVTAFAEMIESPIVVDLSKLDLLNPDAEEQDSEDEEEE